MGTPTNYYVDPVGGNDTTGDGSISTPWKTAQKALDTITRDATNGDQINVKAGGGDVLSAPLSFATYGNGGATNPLIIRGYTAVANDGGIGEISGGGSVGIIASTSLATYMQCVDMVFRDTGANYVLDSSSSTARWLLVNCKIADSTAVGVRSRIVQVQRCHFDNLDTALVPVGSSGFSIASCYFVNITTYAINPGSVGGNIIGNIFNLSGAAVGVLYRSSTGTQDIIAGNTFYSAGGTGMGLRFVLTNDYLGVLTNNHFEGFSGAGGYGVYTNGSDIGMAAGNTFYNNTTHSSYGDRHVVLLEDQTLGASPLTDPVNGDFSVSDALKAAGWPTAFLGSNTAQFLDVGASQREESSAAALAASIFGGLVVR